MSHSIALAYAASQVYAHVDVFRTAPLARTDVALHHCTFELHHSPIAVAHPLSSPYHPLPLMRDQRRPTAGSHVNVVPLVGDLHVLHKPHRNLSTIMSSGTTGSASSIGLRIQLPATTACPPGQPLNTNSSTSTANIPGISRVPRRIRGLKHTLRFNMGDQSGSERVVIELNSLCLRIWPSLSALSSSIDELSQWPVISTTCSLSEIQIYRFSSDPRLQRESSAGRHHVIARISDLNIRLDQSLWEASQLTNVVK